LRKVDPSEYRLRFFREAGFVRKQCPRCGSFFWTRNPQQKFCNDAPCVEYNFWSVEKKVRGLTLSEVRRKFVDFFRRRGHSYINPHPVVARWREDLYLTIASIVVFQPHVTKGIVPPPANPLVIVQPCIRLEDIDNVGVTIGRHLTSFEMGGHHAFNYPNKHVYWKEETVEFAYEFFTRELGIPDDQITFKESWWEGGGNAGPSFEVAVGGLELATLVFMSYEVVNGSYREMPLKVVDTGYGMERIAWFVRETPTAFHAIYGDLVAKFHEVLGVPEPEERILWVAARLAGRLDPDDPSSRQWFYSEVARRLSASVEEVRRQLDRTAKVYAILDHTKTIALMLGDGIVPSNTGEGYLARLVIRRALRWLALLGVSDVKLSDLVKLQIDLWSRDYYPQLARMRSYILDVVEREEERYHKALEHGLRFVEKLIRRRRSIGVDELIELYDSQGVPPDIVAEVASKHGVTVEIPHDFYARVARRHGASGLGKTVEEKPKLPAEVAKWALQYPDTRRIFHEDPYARVFTARVLGFKGSYLVLDRTAFYPTGGGQLHDTGVIEACGETFRVTRVEKVGGVVVHVLDRDFNGCSEVRGVIDWDRRYKLMRHHTAVHILLGVLRKLLGEHVWQAGAEKTPEKARLDVTHYELPSPQLLRKIEDEVNRIIEEARPVKTMLLPRYQAEARYGFRLYQGGVPLEPEIRVVEVEGIDAEACFGTHVRNTAEVGAVKIVNVERIQDGVIRFELVAGGEVASYARALENRLKKIATMIGAGVGELEARVAKLIERVNELKESSSRLRQAVVRLLLDLARERKTVVGRVGVYILEHVEGLEAQDYRDAMKKIVMEDRNSVVIAVTGLRRDGVVVEVSRGEAVDLDLRELVKDLKVRGGGKQDHVTLMMAEKPSEAIRRVYNAVTSKLTS
jgi:alanyl-tRNA synthetase